MKANASLLPTSIFQDRIPRATLYLRASSVDAAGHETMSTEEVAVNPANLITQEPKLNPVFLGAAGSISANGGEFVWGGT